MADRKIELINRRAVVTVSGAALVAPLVARQVESQTAPDRAAVAAVAADRAAIETALAEIQEVASGAPDAPSVLVRELALKSKTYAETRSVAAGTAYLRTAGYAEAGDGGAALYRLVDAEPAHPGKLQTDDGQWWEYVPGDLGVDARAFGARLDGTPTAAALSAAANVARAMDEGFFVGGTGILHIEASLNLNYIRRIRIEANIEPSAALVASEPAVTVGGFHNGLTVDWWFNDIVVQGTSTITSPPPAHACLLIAGAKNSPLRHGSINLIEFRGRANAGPDFESVGYMRVTSHGHVTRLLCTDDGNVNSWVNGNNFYADRMDQWHIVQVGPYEHNHNIVFGGQFEGANVDIRLSGYSNYIRDARFEDVASAVGVVFSAGSYNNEITYSWTGQGNGRDLFRTPCAVVDNGAGNDVRSNQLGAWRKNELFTVGPESQIVSTETETSAPNTRIAVEGYGLLGGKAILVPGRVGVTVPANEFIAATDPIIVNAGDAITFEPDFDGALIRPVVNIYDADSGLSVTSESGGAYIDMVSAAAFNATHGLYTVGADLAADTMPPIVVLRRCQIRVGVYSGTGGFLRSLQANLWTQPAGRGRTDVAASPSPALVSLNGAPSAGFVRSGFCVFDRIAKVMRWVSFRLETTVSGGLSAGATSVTLSSIGSTADGDLLELTLDNGRAHWVKLSGLSGSTAQMKAADGTTNKPIPFGRSVASGSKARLIRWAS